MKLTLITKGFEPVDTLWNLENTANKKFAKLDRYFRKEIDVSLVIKYTHNMYKAEVTVPYGGFTFRVEETDNDAYTAVNTVLDKLERQIIKNKNKYKNRFSSDDFVNIPLTDEFDEVEDPTIDIVKKMNNEDKIVAGVNDSKKLTEKKREKLFDDILENAIAYHIELIDHKVIDEINILNATKLGMKNCIEKLEVKPDLVLIDAVKLDVQVPTESIIKGDAKSYNIACASILAKVSRDRLMLELDEIYPEYGFKKHKGYGTKAHIEALKQYGKCEIHRDSFIKNFVGK